MPKMKLCGFKNPGVKEVRKANCANCGHVIQESEKFPGQWWHSDFGESKLKCAFCACMKAEPKVS